MFIFPFILFFSPIIKDIYKCFVNNVSSACAIAYYGMMFAQYDIMLKPARDPLGSSKMHVI
jgi:hypothetical protein